jgi:IS5 family transposase
MPPKKPSQSEFELFRMLLTNMINMGHPLVKAANEIDWTRFDAAWDKFCHEKKGRPGAADAVDGGTPSAQAHARTVGRGGVRQVG